MECLGNLDVIVEEATAFSEMTDHIAKDVKADDVTPNDFPSSASIPIPSTATAHIHLPPHPTSLNRPTTKSTPNQSEHLQDKAPDLDQS